MDLSLFDLRQSTAELLACAVLELFPQAYLIGGGATEFGFYYDFIAEQPIDTHALPFLEEKIRGLIKQDLEVRKLEMMRENAAMLFEHKEQPFKANRIREARENVVPIFQLGTFYDYCPLPYISKTLEIGAFKLFDVERVKRYLPETGEIEAVRICGTTVSDKMALKKFTKTREAGKKRDHRLIADDLNLFTLNEEISSLAWCWLPKGTEIRQILLDWWHLEHRKQNFKNVVTPPLIKEDLLDKSGLDENRDAPRCQIQDVEYVIPSDISPAHAALFRAKSITHLDMPVRLAECGFISQIKNDPLWGIFNSHLVLSDQAHIFCTPEQVEKELISSLQFIDGISKIFSLECHWRLKGRNFQSAGTDASWKKGIECFGRAFEKSGLNYVYDECGYFSGPIAQALLVDSAGREWEGPRIGIDFNIPERFELRYRAVDGKLRMPIMIVRSLFGSLERFIAILVEHFAGRLPLWITPEQVRVIPVNESNNAYAERICRAMIDAGFRASIVYGPEQLGSRIHGAEKEKIPYIAIVGEKEENQYLITVRSSIQEIVRQEISLESFLKQLHEEVNSKAALPRVCKNNSHQ